MKYIVLFNNTITMLSFAVNIFFLATFIYKVYKYFSQKRYIKKVLSYNNEPIQIYQAANNYISVEGFESEIVTYDSLEGLYNILNLFSIVNKKSVFVNLNDTAKNEICIGGFLYNKRVNSYFINYFKNFKYYIDLRYKNYYEKVTTNSTILEYTNDKYGFYINENLFLEIIPAKTDYAFLIKLIPNDFYTGTNKTVHILFGGRSISTVKATEYLETQYKEIYKKYKNNHYFFAVEINLIDNSFNHKKGIIDLTNEMFS